MIPISISIALMALDDPDDRDFIIRLYKEHRKLMYAVALRIVHDRQIAEDMVSNAVINMIGSINTLRKVNRCRLRSYIVSIVRNNSIDYLRKCQRESRCSFLTDDYCAFDHASEQDTPEEAFLKNVEIEELRSGIAELPENERLLLTLKYVDELSDAEIADMLNIKKNSVRGCMFRARKHLKKIICGDENHDRSNQSPPKRR